MFHFQPYLSRDKVIRGDVRGYSIGLYSIIYTSHAMDVTVKSTFYPSK